mmetsp:Transcript_4567/g.6951  ORF Transcript_4567/g.6951 Transcript_4567/m.6951 type:complete len:185 (+) Transcript_4567:241-795(+)
MSGISLSSYSTILKVHLEDGHNVLRAGTKQLTASTGGGEDGGINVQYYKYKVHCSRDILVGDMLQTTFEKDLFKPGNPLFRNGGLCSILTMNYKPGLAVEYRGNKFPIAEAQDMTVGNLLGNHSSKTVTLEGNVDIFACLPCCCFFQKLLFPSMIPWNQYDIFDPDHDFSSAPSRKKMDRATKV